jgi:hypothetical protein
LTDPDPLDALKARWTSDELHTSNYWADLASRDVPWLIGEVERLRRIVDKPLGAIWRQVEEQTRAQWFGDRREADRLRELLGRLEWASGTYCDEAACPECSQRPRDGHYPDCWLAAELHRPDPVEEPPPAEGTP